MKEIDLMEESLLEPLDLESTELSDALMDESIGSQNEFFDDHQKWMIESFDI